MKTLLPWMAVVAVALDSGCQMPMFAKKNDANSIAPLIAADKTRTPGELGPLGTEDEMLAAGTPRNRQPTRSPAHSPSPPGTSAGPVAQRLEEGHAALRKGLVAQAKQHYEAVLQLQPRHPDAHHRLAIIADNQKNYQAAETHYLTALQAKPRDANLLSDLGYSYRLQRRLDESERYLKQAIEVQPTHKHALSNLGVLYAMQEDYDGALEMFLQAGDEADAYANMAKLFPQGRPPAGGTDPADSSFAKEFNALVAADAAGLGLQQAESNAPMQELKQMLEQERHDRLAADNTPHATPGWAQQPAAQGSHDDRQTMAAAPQHSYPGARAATSGRSPMGADPRAWPGQDGFEPSAPADVPDSGLNHAMAAIDKGRRYVNGPAASSGSAADAFGPGERGPQITPRFPGTNEAPNTERLPSITPAVQPVHLAQTDPLDSMETWPPTAAGNSFRSNVDLASGTIEPWPHAGNDIRPAGLPDRNALSSEAGSSMAAWPEGPMGAGARSANDPRIQPVDYSVAGSQQPAASLQDNAVRQAALLGMSAGPGQMFPVTAADLSSLSSAPSVPAGTGSRISGSQYAAPPRYDRSRSQTDFRQDQAASYGIQTSGRPDFNGSQLGRDTGAVRPVSAMNDGRTAAESSRYTMFSSDGSTRASYGETGNPPAANGREPLSEYAAQVRRHSEEFGSTSRQLHAERQLTSPRPPAWPSQPPNFAANDPSHAPDAAQRRAPSQSHVPQWNGGGMPSGADPFRHQTSADPPASFEFAESPREAPGGSGRPSAGFDSSPDTYPGATITPRSGSY